MKHAHLALLAALAGTVGSAAFAQVKIDHSKALAGAVTPGDAPGYPVTLSIPGHYVLTGDLNVPANTSGIEIASPHVTLDLNGFSIAGPVSCTQDNYSKAVNCNAARNTSIAGIQAGSIANLVARNGTVRGFAGYGIYSLGSAVVEHMAVTSNADIGLVMMGVYGGLHRATNTRVWLNGARGGSFAGALVERSNFSSNHSDGLYAERSAIVDTLVQNNGDRGIEGDSHNPGAGNYGTPTTLRGVTLIGNKNGSHEGYLFSTGGNFNGSAAF